MSKGSKRRNVSVGAEEFDDNWELAFHRGSKNRQSMKNRRKPKEDDGKSKED